MTTRQTRLRPRLRLGFIDGCCSWPHTDISHVTICESQPALRKNAGLDERYGFFDSISNRSGELFFLKKEDGKTSQAKELTL
jgi:hypothetical protein